MFSVKNIVQNVRLIELWGNNLVHYILSSPKAIFSYFSQRAQCQSSGDLNLKDNDNIFNFSW